MVKKLRIRFTVTAAIALTIVLVVVGVAINVLNYFNFISSTQKTLSVIAANNGEFPDYEDYLRFVEEERLKEERAKLETTEEDTEDASEDETEVNEKEEAQDPDGLTEVRQTEGETEIPSGKDPDGGEDDSNEESATETLSLEDSLLDKFDYTAGFGFGLKVTAETAYETRYFYVRFAPDSNMIGYDLSHIANVTKEEAESLGRTILGTEEEDGVYGSYRFFRHETEGGSTEIIFLNCATQLRSFNFILFISIIILAAVLAAVTAAVWLLSKKIVKPFVDNLEKQKQFVTDAGHEIKTPLAIIDANAEVLKLTSGDNEWIDSIQHQTSRLSSLVKKLVTLSKSEEELDDIPFEDFNISYALAETVSPFSLLAEKNGIRLEENVEPDIVCKGNEASIRQLFEILLDNAIKYTPRGGTIRVSLENRGKTVFEIYNDCEELDAEKIPQYFDRFFRADDSRSRDTGGYGIGLSIAKAIVERHRGKISAESKDSHSITFTVTL
ncbi:MAG: GHKL domain-containing protein [Clostridia bacterium]|nr:GHKL domain-containing protein [Clostridia bacterium]